MCAFDHGEVRRTIQSKGLDRDDRQVAHAVRRILGLDLVLCAI